MGEADQRRARSCSCGVSDRPSRGFGRAAGGRQAGGGGGGKAVGGGQCRHRARRRCGEANLAALRPPPRRRRMGALGGATARGATRANPPPPASADVYGTSGGQRRPAQGHRSERECAIAMAIATHIGHVWVLCELGRGEADGRGRDITPRGLWARHHLSLAFAPCSRRRVRSISVLHAPCTYVPPGFKGPAVPPRPVPSLTRLRRPLLTRPERTLRAPNTGHHRTPSVRLPAMGDAVREHTTLPPPPRTARRETCGVAHRRVPDPRETRPPRICHVYVTRPQRREVRPMFRTHSP